MLVRFTHPVDGRTDYVFGCLRAIFDHFSSAQVDTTLRKLWIANAGKGRKVFTRTCTIERLKVFTSRQRCCDDKSNP